MLTNMFFAKALGALQQDCLRATVPQKDDDLNVLFVSFCLCPPRAFKDKDCVLSSSVAQLSKDSLISQFFACNLAVCNF